MKCRGLAVACVWGWCLVSAGCERTSLIQPGPAVQSRSTPNADAKPDAAAVITPDSAPNVAKPDRDAASPMRADLAIDRIADVRNDARDTGSVSLDAGTYGLFSDDGGSVANNWAINDRHDNAQPNDKVASPLTKAWTAHFTGLVSYPLVAKGRVFVATVATEESRPDVRALDLQTGAVIWGPITIGSQVWMACDAENLYTLDRDGSLSALDVGNGHPRWSTQLTHQSLCSSPPVAAAGMVFVDGQGSGGTTHAIDAATGKTRWTVGTIDGSDGSVAVVDNVVYEAEACGQVSAFDLLTGSRLWYRSGPCTGGGGTTPAVAGGQIWVRDLTEGNIIVDLMGKAVGTFSADVQPALYGGLALYVKSRTLTSIDVSTSAVKWTFSGDKDLCTSAVIAGRGGQAFVGSSGGNIYEVDLATGEQVSTDVAGTTVSCSSETQGMAIAQNHLLVPAGNDLVVY